jgi:hypothetical protein
MYCPQRAIAWIVLTTPLTQNVIPNEDGKVAFGSGAENSCGPSSSPSVPSVEMGATDHRKDARVTSCRGRAKPSASTTPHCCTTSGEISYPQKCEPHGECESRRIRLDHVYQTSTMCCFSLDSGVWYRVYNSPFPESAA